jgi:hypothetical protein
MGEQSHDNGRAYGWADFDPEVVEGLVENDSRFINRRQDGWIACPLAGHYDDKLRWRDDNYRKGSVPSGDPPASFRAAPTYVLESALDNFIAGRDLIGEAIAGRWGRAAETGRLGNEWSDDAVAWNVLRSLQEAGCLSVAARILAGTDTTSEPDLYFWGQHLELSAASTWTELQAIQNELEHGLAEQTEPDACLHIEGWGWVLIEASFGSSTDVYDDPARVEEWLERYSHACPGVFDDEAIRGVKLREFPQRLLRDIALAHKLKSAGEHAFVVSLARENDPITIEKWVARCLAATIDVGFRRATWEALYRALDPDDRAVENLRRYMENKSYGLRPAFALHEADPADVSL